MRSASFSHEYGNATALNNCGRGQYYNRFFTVKPGENKLPAVCFNSCKLCEKASNTGFVCQDPKASNFQRDRDGSFKCHYWDLLYADEFAGDKLQVDVYYRAVGGVVQSVCYEVNVAIHLLVFERDGRGAEVLDRARH